jgi:hypothetical protein
MFAMQDFFIFLKLGFQHITDLNGYDHMLFIVSLCAIFTLEDWKKIFIAITFFTFGHTITLALAVLDIVKVNSNWVEFLIPITILFTCIMNIFFNSNKPKSNFRQNFRLFFTLFFGLIHGLGFSNYLRGLMGNGNSIVRPLFAFNIGLELGQLLIVFFIILINLLLINGLNVKKDSLNLVVSAFVAGITITLIIDKWIF